MGLCRWHGGIICFCCAIFYNWFCEGEDMKSIEDIYQKAPLLQMGGKWQIITGSAIIRTLVERQALEELHEVNNHQEELGGSGYSSRETPNRQTQMNKN